MSLLSWISNLRRSFGTPFLLLVFSIYWTQGFRSFPWTAISFVMKDEMQLSPAASQMLTSTAFIPWSIKPLYGIISDCLAINGQRRVPYLLLSNLLSLLSWVLLSLSPPSLSSSLPLFTALLVVQNVGAAMADVVIDAMIAEAARKEKESMAGDLQSLSWFSMATGGVLGSICGGLGLKFLSPRGVFAAFSLLPLAQLAACMMTKEKELVADGGDGEGEEGEGEGEVMIEIRRLSSKGEGRGRVGRSSREHKGDGDESHAEVGGGGEEGKLERQEQQGGRVEGHGREEGRGGVEGKGGVEGALVDGLEERGVGAVGRMEGVHDVKSGINGMNGMDSISGKDEMDGMYSADGALPEASNLSSGQQQQQQLRQRRLSTAREEGAGGREEEEEEGGVGGKGEKGRGGGQGSVVWRDMKRTMRTLVSAMRQPEILRPLLWFSLSCAVVPSFQTSIFYFHTNHLRLDPSFLGSAKVVGWGGLMLGTLLYNSKLKYVPIRRIFRWAHLLMAFSTLLDIILVTRLNLALNIPDKAFVLGSFAINDAVSQFKFMPFLVLSARLCPPGIEGTLFAVFMSAFNLGNTISGYFGASVATQLGITGESFENLPLGILFQSLGTLVPILFLSYVPAGASGAIEEEQEIRKL